MSKPKDGFTFTVGKLDAGMAILLGERAHLIEFPSILLPPGATAGSIVNISVHQNHEEEDRRDRAFWDLQNDIYETFGRDYPEPPKLELRNVTQTSVTLEWPPLQLATSQLRSLDIHRNGQRLATIPAPLQNTSTKLSGLELDHDYTFQLFLRTTAGVFPSNPIRVRTHTMTDTSGISVCFGNVQDNVLLERAKIALGEMHAKWSDKIQIDTTHFVCTTPAATPSGAQASGNQSGAPGVEYQRALQLSIPVVQPQWILACHAERRMVPISGYYLGATPNTPMNAPPFTRPQSMSQVSLASPTRSNSTGTTAIPKGAGNRSSMPPMARAGTMSPKSPETQARALEVQREEPEEPDTEQQRSKLSSKANEEEEDDQSARPPPPLPSAPTQPPPAEAEDSKTDTTQPPKPRVIAPSSIEVPPPPPIEKEHTTRESEEGDEDVGATEEIPL